MRTIISIGLLLVVSVVSFAQDDHEVDKQKIDNLIKSGLNKNFEAIQQEVADLDEAERLAIYNRYQISKRRLFAAPAPFGIGNFIQRDKAWGGLVLAGEVIGGGLFYVGAMMTFVPIISIVGIFTSQGQKMTQTGIIVFRVGYITAAISYVFGMIRAFIHLPAYNKKLRSALQLDTMTMSIEPEVNMSKHGITLTLVSATF